MEDEFKLILDSISKTGSASAESAKINPIVNVNRDALNHIINFSSGLPKIRPSIASKFELELSKPVELNGFHQFEIRCCLCREVIRFPAWHYVQRFAINHFHYFVCLDKSSPLQVTAKCYRR